MENYIFCMLLFFLIFHFYWINLQFVPSINVFSIDLTSCCEIYIVSPLPREECERRHWDIHGYLICAEVLFFFSVILAYFCLILLEY